MEMEDQYSMPDHRRQLIDGIRPTHFQAIPQDLLSPGHHRNLQPPPPQHHHPFDMMQMVGMGMGMGRQQVIGDDDDDDDELMPRTRTTATGVYDDQYQFPNSDSSTVPNNTSVGVGVGGVTRSVCTPIPISAASCGFDGEFGAAASFGGGSGSGRWPRQETLTLLEIRSRLDPNFKDANQKAPLWDQVSRIMSEEHGYQRSGKKCREKLENLYKYYKKTKEGKSGRQDGKHYRFFRQLEALYGGDQTSCNHNNNNNNHIPVNSGQEENTHHQVGNYNFPFHATQEAEVYRSQNLCDHLSLSANSLAFETCTSSDNDNDLSTAAAAILENNDISEINKRKKKRGFKAKVKEFMDSQMRKLVERQEAWLEKLSKTLEQKEQERISREEEWRKEEAARADKEQQFWAKERAWIEARDAALMDTLTAAKQLKAAATSSDDDHQMQNQGDNLNGTSHETVNNKKRKEKSSTSPGLCYINYGHGDIIIDQGRGAYSEILNGNGENYLWDNYGLKGSDQNQ